MQIPKFCLPNSLNILVLVVFLHFDTKEKKKDNLSEMMMARTSATLFCSARKLNFHSENKCRKSEW